MANRDVGNDDCEAGLMTPDLMRALVISAGILITVFILIVVVSMVTVRRGEVQMTAQNKHGR